MTSPAPATTKPRIRRLNAGFGAVVTDIDISRPLDAKTIAEIRAAWLDHQVLFFPGQHIGPDEQTAFAAQLGELTAGSSSLKPLDDEHDKVVAFDTSRFDERAGYSVVNHFWHADVTFAPTPPAGAVFNVVTLPPAGGSTAFASAQVGYESLSAPIQDLLDHLVASHGYGDTVGSNELHWEGDVLEGDAEHPVVVIHPETGRKGLYVNPLLTRHIKGLSATESSTLLNLLYEQTTRLENVIQYHWQEGDVALWDNRAVWHRRVADNKPGEKRVIHRVQLRGTRPVGVTGAVEIEGAA